MTKAWWTRTSVRTRRMLCARGCSRSSGRLQTGTHHLMSEGRLRAPRGRWFPYSLTMPTDSLLLVVGSNPPSQTSGQRTVGRVRQAAAILGFEEALVVNLFSLPTHRSGGIADLGGEAQGWLAARPSLSGGLDRCQGVLLAYGVQGPSGPARTHQREQVRWLDGQIEQRSLPTWWVGGAPRHPSRWQRYTHRQHPGLSFEDALAQGLAARQPGFRSWWADESPEFAG